MEKVFDSLIEKAGGLKHDFIFLCSNDLRCDLKTYKGVKILFSAFLQNETIIYMKSPYTKNNLQSSK